MEAKDRIIVALDVSNAEEATKLVKLLSPYVGLFKIGLEFIWSSIADLLLLPQDQAICLLGYIRNLAGAIGGQHCFMDGKFADIPNTVKGASVAASRMGVKMFNIHASAGKEAIIKAVENKGNALVLGVTVLTSIDEDECKSIFGEEPNEKVFYFALKLAHNKADGIICSPKELKFLSQYPQIGNLLKVTPNIRPEWARKKDDQDISRQMTPREAIKAGADYLVIGRPITQPPSEIGGPVEAAKKIAEEIEQALKER